MPRILSLSALVLAVLCACTGAPGNHGAEDTHQESGFVADGGTDGGREWREIPIAIGDLVFSDESGFLPDASASWAASDVFLSPDSGTIRATVSLRYDGPTFSSELPTDLLFWEVIGVYREVEPFGDFVLARWSAVGAVHGVGEFTEGQLSLQGAAAPAWGFTPPSQDLEYVSLRFTWVRLWEIDGGTRLQVLVPYEAEAWSRVDRVNPPIHGTFAVRGLSAVDGQPVHPPQFDVRGWLADAGFL
jgi:hypothetical protein